QQQVILFKGCSSDLFEQQTLNDAVRLLNACRFDVVIPDKQQCCGAISARQGDTHQMKALAKQNIAQLQPLLQKSQAIISITNSCSGQLKEYNKLTDSFGLKDGLKDGLGDGLKDAAINGAAEFSDKVTDIIAFLAQAVKTAEIQFAPLAEAIGVHIPCSLQNVLKEEALLFDLLAHIPGVRLIKINDQYCCGAAGSYMLQYPEVANRLLDDKIEDVMQQHYSIIVSSNIGCSLHFKQGLKKHEQKIGRAVEVIHPVSLLARQLVISEEKA
ncbi:MAG: (Fe-S)-binding protein, partial [Gammaproteobacteria bacterium]|nr:(Fe-S)-binding protein [Gammaproteobacteria bacterium]